MSTPFNSPQTPDEIAKAFRYDNRLSLHGLEPAPRDVPGLTAELEELHAARDEWREITETLEDVAGQIRHAQARDATTLRDAVLTGKPPTGSLTPAFDQLMRDLSAARVRVDAAKRRLSNAISVLRHQIQRDKVGITAALQERADELAELVAPYYRAVNAVRQHLDNVEYMARFVSTTDQYLGNWGGRSAEALPKLPPPLVKESE